MKLEEQSEACTINIHGDVSGSASLLSPMDLRLDCCVNCHYHGKYCYIGFLVKIFEEIFGSKMSFNTNAQNNLMSELLAQCYICLDSGLAAHCLAAFANNRNKIIIHEYVPFEY